MLSPSEIVNRSKSLRTTRAFFQPKSGRTVPVPASLSEQGALRSTGYRLCEVLVNTATGGAHEISCERASALLRTFEVRRSDVRDMEHFGQPAFMRVTDYLRLSEAERIALLWTPPTSEGEREDKAATALEIARATQNAAELRARVAELEAKLAKSGRT